MTLQLLAFILIAPLALQCTPRIAAPMDVDAEGVDFVDPDAGTPRVVNICGVGRAPSYHGEADVKARGRIPTAAERTLALDAPPVTNAAAAAAAVPVAHQPSSVDDPENFVTYLQVRLCTERERKHNAERLKALLATLPATILERLLQTTIKRDPKLAHATKCVHLRGTRTVGNNCLSSAIIPTPQDVHSANSPSTMLSNALQSSMSEVINTILKPTFLPPVLIAIIMGYAPYHPTMSPHDLMNYRNFDYMDIRPQHGAPPAIDRANTLDLSHSGLTDLRGLHAIAQKAGSLDSTTQGTLGQALLHLRFNCNHLTHLPLTHEHDALPQAFPHCSVIDLSNNQLTHIPRGTLPHECTHTFLLAHNYLAAMPQDIMERAERLRGSGWRVHITVDVSGNPLLHSESECKKIDELRAMDVTVITDTPAPGLPA